ncbi:MAG: hypothetical protein J6U63_02700 [Clostridia bacterium]|nr:hypothetical protein [Clostridia bacterium]
MSESRKRPQAADRRRTGNTARPAARKAEKPGFLKTVAGVLLTLGKYILLVLITLVQFVLACVKGVYRFFDRFRKGEASSIVINALLAGALVLILLSVFMLCKPSIDASRAVRKAASGDAAQAVTLIRSAESGGLKQSKLNSARVKMARAFAEGGQYASARQALSEAGDSQEKTAVSQMTDYREAESLMAAGSWSAAAGLYYRLGDYLDSADKYENCLCVMAVQAYIDGGEARARSLLAELDGAEDRMDAAFAALGRSDLKNEALFSAESLAAMRRSYEELRQNRETIHTGLIAAGARHTVLVRADGTVLACGDDSSGQCRVSEWRDIVMAAAGSAHTVGLRRDGTVVACGDDSEGQCRVSEWTDVVSVAASAFGTVALKSDGTVVACGRDAALVSSWRDVEAVTGGGYAFGALGKNGSMLCSRQGALLPMDIRMFSVAVCGGTSAGILYDGSLVTSLSSSPAWRNLSMTAVSETGLFAVTLEGEVLAEYFRAGDDMNIRVNGKAQEISASGAHAAVLMADGSVRAFGSNAYGQTNVNGWKR